MKQILVFALALGLLASCQKKVEKDASHSQVTEELNAHEQHEEEAAATGEIELNQGEKWIVNEEMKPYVAEGEKLVGNYIENQETEYKVLAASLEKQNSNLITSCTMKGKSHEELHKWLSPHLELVKDLASSTDEVTAMNTAKEIQQSYKTYHEYFQ